MPSLTNAAGKPFGKPLAPECFRRLDEEFTCPKCGAQYKLVRMPAPADLRDPPLHCKICSQEFASTDEGNILKYFLVGRRRRSRPAALSATH